MDEQYISELFEPSEPISVRVYRLGRICHVSRKGARETDRIERQKRVKIFCERMKMGLGVFENTNIFPNQKK